MILEKTFKNEQDALRCIDKDLWENGYLSEDVRVVLADIDFHDACDDIIVVYKGDKDTYIVVDNRDFDEILVFKMQTVIYYAKWWRFVWEDLYFQKDHSHLCLWFNIGQKGDHMVQWVTAIIDGNFSPDSIRIQEFEEDPSSHNGWKEIWVKPTDPRATIPKSVDGCFDDLDKVAEKVLDSYWGENDVHFDGRNWLHIYDCFDMNQKGNWYGGKSLWD